MKAKRVAGDLVLSISAVMMMNVVLQLVVYPVIQGWIGEARFGDMVYSLGIINIFAPALGQACANRRLITQALDEDKNAGYLFALLAGGALLSVVTGLFLQGTGLLWLPLFFLIALRTYANVEYRLRLNYKGYFVFYAVLSVGYILGLYLLYPYGGWQAQMIGGEALSVLLVLLMGRVLRPAGWNWPDVREVLKPVAVLTFSYILYNAVIFMDRIVLKWVLDSTAVTLFYVASLLGKTVAMVAAPLSAVLISYLSKMKSSMNRRFFLKLCAAALGFGALVYAATVVAYPIFIRLLYPNLYEDVIHLGWLGNLSQVLCFVGSLLLTVLLVIASEKWQLAIQSGYMVLFFALTCLGARLNGLSGFMAAAVAVNFLRLLAIIGCGMVWTRQKD